METETSRARLDLDTDENLRLLRRELGVTSFGINQITLRPRQRLRIHRHEHQEEVYLVVEGTLNLLVQGEEQVLERGELIRVGPEVRRQLTNRGEQSVVLLAIGGSGEHQSRDGIAYPDWDSEESEGRPPQEIDLPPDLPS